MSDIGALPSVTEAQFTAADRAYISAEFSRLEELCSRRNERPIDALRLMGTGLLPQPSYVVDSVGWFPADHFRLYDEAGSCDGLKTLFEQRYRSAAALYPSLTTTAAVEAAWLAYLGGIWGRCLRQVSPETIVRKSALVDSLCSLLVLACPRDAAWRRQLRDEIDELDRLERDFAPDFDRAEEWNERPPTRDLVIEEARRRFPDVFASS